MKATQDAAGFNAQLSNLKTSLVIWEDFIAKSNKLNASLNTTIQCVTGFLEAFQKISDIAQTNNFGLQDLGMAMTRYCIRQRGMESRLRTFNSQLNEYLVIPLSDRVEDWRRTVNQIDRDTVKELRKARSELQRASVEADKCRKRLKRKDSTSTMQTMLAFASSVHNDNVDGQSGPNVQINFAQRDLVCKQQDLEQLERDCLKRVLVEERRRFAELTTCLGPVLDSQLQFLGECGPLEEAVTTLRHHMSDTTKPFPDPNNSSILDPSTIIDNVDDSGLRLRPTPLTLDQRAAQPEHVNLSPSIETGSAAHSFAAARPLLVASQLSLNSTGSSAFGFIVGGVGGLDNGNTAVGSASTLQNSNAGGLPHPPHVRHNPPGVASPCQDSMSATGDVISLFDAHNNADVLSMNSFGSVNAPNDASSAISYNAGVSRGPGSDGFSDGLSPTARNGFFPRPQASTIHRATSSSSQERISKSKEQEEEDEAHDESTSKGGTEDDDDDEEEEEDEECPASHRLQRRHTLGPAMEKSVLYPDQSLPPPVYTNFSQLQKAAAQKIGGKIHASEQQQQSNENKPSTPMRKFSQPATVFGQSKPTPPGLSLLRNLSMSGSCPGSPILSHTPLPLEEVGCAGGEGLSFSSPTNFDNSPIITDQTTSPSQYAQARSRIDAMFSNTHAKIRNLKNTRQSTGMPTGNNPEETMSLGGGEIDSQPPPLLLDQDHQAFAGVNSGTSTFRRPRNTNTAGITRGSMFHLDRHFQQGGMEELGAIDRYGYPIPQQPAPLLQQTQQQIKTNGSMTLTPGSSNQIISIQDGDVGIRPPRRSSSVSRELPSLGCRDSSNNIHRILGNYASPRSLGGPQQRHSLADSCRQQGVAGAPSLSMAAAPIINTTSQASQLAAEAATKRLGQQQKHQSESQQHSQHYASPCGMRSPGIKVLPDEILNGNGNLNNSQSRLPQRSQNSPIGMIRPPGNITTPKTQRLVQNQQQPAHQNQQQYQQQNQYHPGGPIYRPQYGMGVQQHYMNSPLPPAAFCTSEEIDSTSFIDSSKMGGQ